MNRYEVQVSRRGKESTFILFALDETAARKAAVGGGFKVISVTLVTSK